MIFQSHMAISSRISSAELESQVSNRFVGKWIQVCLADAPGLNYIPGNPGDDGILLGAEVDGTTVSSYSRRVIGYAPGDVSTYTDDGIALATKAAIFEHDGLGDPIDFTHVFLVWAVDPVATLGANTSGPSTANDGDYTANFPVSTTGNGSGMLVNITVANGGAALTDYTLTVVNGGGYYAPGDTLTVAGADLVSAGVTDEVTDLVFSVGTIISNPEANNVISVSRMTSPVTLSNGQQAGFYFNLKQFGYYEV